MTEKNIEVPADRCGFKLRPENVGAYTPPWEIETSPVCCWRPVWESHDGTDRCIWHADVDEKPLEELLMARADFPERLDGAIFSHLCIIGEELSLGGCTLLGTRFDNAILPNIDFTDADLRWAHFTDANLAEADFTDADLTRTDFTGAHLPLTNFTDAHLPGANFTDSRPQTAKFTGADLTTVEFTGADLINTNFTDANLEGADLSVSDAKNANFRHANLQDAAFTRTDCRGATFTSALLYETVFADTRINSTTTFFDPETTFYTSITSRPGCVYEENPLTTNNFRNDLHTAYLQPQDVQPLEAARWVYRRLETLHEDNALSEEARQFHISKEEAEQALYSDLGKYRRWGAKRSCGILRSTVRASHTSSAGGASSSPRGASYSRGSAA